MYLWRINKNGKKEDSLVIYGLSVVDGENKRISLNHIIDNRSLIDIVENYIKDNISLYSQNSSKEILFQFEQVSAEAVKNADGQKRYEILYGRVKTGEYGIESELVDVQTGDVINRTPNQADMMPFGFCIAVPLGEINSAVIIFANDGSLWDEDVIAVSFTKMLYRFVPGFKVAFPSNST